MEMSLDSEESLDMSKTKENNTVFRSVGTLF